MSIRSIGQVQWSLHGELVPLPNLASYSALSAVGFATALGYASTSAKGFYHTIQSEVWCTWALLNMACCCCFLLGQLIISQVFGELRASEHQHLRDKFWNFVFYKFIFVFGVMDVQDLGDILGWCMWFAALGFFLLISELAKDRFEYLSFSPTTPTATYVKIIALLIGILFSCGGLLMVCAIVGWQLGISYFAFLSSQVFILSMRTIYTLIRYVVHLWDMHHSGHWENKAAYMHYVELVLELAALSVDFMHHLHMIVWGHWFPSMASLVLMMKLRFLYQEIQHKVKKHHNYLHVSNSLDSRFPVATSDEICSQSQCAICWETMSHARKLPCGHIFHNACLHSWLQHDQVCPMCRESLKELLGLDHTRTEGQHASEEPGVVRRIGRRAMSPRNRLLQFNGSTLASWLPTFSVDLHSTDMVWMQEAEELHQSAEQIHSLFPQVPLSAIIIDLTRTRSANHTMDNILNQTIFIPSAGAGQQLPTELDTLRVAVAADEVLLDDEGEGGVGAGAVESEGKDGEHQTGMRDEAEPSCPDQEECPAEHKDGHDPKELSSNRRRIPCSHRSAASTGI